MNKPECIIFDCDGVLVDSEGINNRVLLEMASEYGVKMDLAEAVEEFSGIRIKEGIKVLQQRASRPFPADFEQLFRAKTYEIFKTEMKAVEGVASLLAGLTVPFCVASSGPVEKIKLNLTVTGLIHYFPDNRIFSGYDINSWKPDPGIFLYAAAEMGCAPAVCAVIEDSKAGIIAAVKGGFKAFGYAKPFNAAVLAGEGANVFYNMSELEGLLGLSTNPA